MYLLLLVVFRACGAVCSVLDAAGRITARVRKYMEVIT